MIVTIFQADAFADTLFKGNPAAICLLQHWIPDSILQKIAAENNLSETAFLVKEGELWHLRWFTPVTEVELCGHATLASAHILFHHLHHPGTEITFSTLSGILKAAKKEDKIELDFPADHPVPVTLPEGLSEALGIRPVHCLKGISDYMLVYEKEENVASLQPDFEALKKTEARGIIVTAPGREYDFVSRFFGPQVGINEDPVTGSTHTLLAPYWAERIGKKTLTARQVSTRGGTLLCTLAGNRVRIAGKVVTYLEGKIYLPDIKTNH